MGVKMSRMRKSYEEQSRGGEFWSCPEGDTLCYIHPPVLEDDEFPLTEGINYIPFAVHYGLGEGNQMGICLDTKKNPILKHPKVKLALKKRGIKLTGKCPVCEAIDSGKKVDGLDPQRSRRQTKYLWGLTPLRFRDKPRGKFQKLTPTPSPAIVGRTLYDGIFDVFDSIGDITDFDSATYVVINRKGRSMTSTKYKVTPDGATTKSPVSLSKGMRRLISDAIEEDGDCDLFSIMSSMVKSQDELNALVTGVPVEDEEEDDYDDEEEIEDDMEEEDDEEFDDDEDDEEEEEDDEEEDDEDELDDDEEDEEEEPEPPKKKTKKKSKASVKVKTKKKSKKKKKVVDDEDDWDLDELDEELDKLSKKKKKKK